MHSRRMPTAHSSSRHGGGGVGLDQIPLNFPLGGCLDQIPLNFHLGCGPGDPPPPSQIPLNFPLGCGSGNLQGMLGPDPPRTRHPPGTRYTPGPGNPQGQAPPWDQTHPPDQAHPRDQAHAPPVNRITDTCKNITLPQNLFVGGN